MFIIIIDLENGLIKYSSAGHPHAYLIKGNQSITTIGVKKAPPLGMFDKIIYQEVQEIIQNGDKICFFSDGIIDLFASEKLSFNDYIYENKGKDIVEIKTNIEKMIHSFDKCKGDTRDDITLILINYLNTNKTIEE